MHILVHRLVSALLFSKYNLLGNTLKHPRNLRQNLDHLVEFDVLLNYITEWRTYEVKIQDTSTYHF